jgi:transcriptional regulator NrdR family protein
MRCSCGNKTSVTHTKRLRDGVIRRLRQCQVCLVRVTTEEWPVSSDHASESPSANTRAARHRNQAAA